MRAGAKVNVQDVELIEFWAVKMEDEGTPKRNKYMSKSATSREEDEKLG